MSLVVASSAAVVVFADLEGEAPNDSPEAATPTIFEPLEDGSGDGNGNENVADALAAAFAVDQESVLALHEAGAGFGLLFHLYTIAETTGMSVEDLLAEHEGGVGLGEMRHNLTDEQVLALESLEPGVKSSGQLISDQHKSQGTGLHTSNGHGPPNSVPAGGPHAGGE